MSMCDSQTSLPPDDAVLHEAGTEQPEPSRKIRWFFWLILGSLSVFFAEVTVGSDMFPFFEPFAILVTWPLYALHILVLGSIVLRQPQPRFASLYFAGCIFGLYEAYITKVLWSPPWNAEALRIGGVAVIETMLLVLYYHAVMAFIVPLAAAERLLTGSGQVVGTLKPWLARWLEGKRFLVAFAVVCGVLQTVGSPSMLHTIGSTASTTGFVLLLVFLWKKAVRGRVYTFSQLMPRGKELGVLAFLLATQYLGLGILLRPEALPGVAGQALILGLYAMFIFLLCLSLKREDGAKEPGFDQKEPWPWQRWFLFGVVMTASSTICEPAADFTKIPIFLALWASGIGLGWVMFVTSVRRVFAKTNHRA